MTSMKAILFGSIGVLAETSDIQRRAYNDALREFGVDWNWNRETYRELLKDAGGQQRLQRLSDEQGGILSNGTIRNIHRRKTELACEEVRSGVELRSGVVALMQEARGQGIRCALVTSTYRPNIDAIIEASGSELSMDDFAAVVTRGDVKAGKPAPDVYILALQRLGIRADEAIAIEDSEASVAAARSAGIYTIATPGLFTKGQDFGRANRVLDSLGGLSFTSLWGRAA